MEEEKMGWKWDGNGIERRSAAGWFELVLRILLCLFASSANVAEGQTTPAKKP